MFHGCTAPFPHPRNDFFHFFQISMPRSGLRNSLVEPKPSTEGKDQQMIR